MRIAFIPCIVRGARAFGSLQLLHTGAQHRGGNDILMGMTSTVTPPIAHRIPTERTLHGTKLQDDYAWLRDVENPEVVAYLEAENAYTEAMTAGHAAQRELLYAEMLSHVQQTDESVPYRDRGWWYWTRTEEGKQYAIHLRRADSPDAAPQVLLDGNQLAEGQSFMAVGDMDVSDSGHLLAYTVDFKGFRQYALRLRDLRSGTEMDFTAERVGSVCWAADSATLFYTVEDEVQKRQYQLWRYSCITGDKTLVLEEPDERFNLAVSRTRDGAYLLLDSSSHITSEVSFLAADQPLGQWQIVMPRVEDVEYDVEHREGYWIIRSNDKGRDCRAYTRPVDMTHSLDADLEVELIPHRAGIMLEAVDVFASFVIACEREQGLPHLRIHRFANPRQLTPAGEISFPDPTYSAYPGYNAEFDVTHFRYAYQSLVAPASVFEYDLETGRSTLLKQQPVPGGFDKSLYATERVWAVASDGVRVPISLVYRKDRFARGSNPLYVYGYGSYGYALPIGFNANRLSLLDRGVVMAYAHIRGGGDMGETWHDAGKMLSKRNTFTDFICCVRHLTASGYGDPARVAIEGGSAGGLLMGAVVNLQPAMFRAVISHVPFVDVMNTMLDPTLPLTIPEYEEWGDPNQAEYFAYMLSYSPYDNLKSGSYPAMLVKTSLHDSQVMYWEPAKYVARLRTLKTDDRPLLLWINMNAGHGGASGRYDHLKEIAFDYAFLLDQLGVHL